MFTAEWSQKTGDQHALAGVRGYMPPEEGVFH